jgi:hypothetical protein
MKLTDKHLVKVHTTTLRITKHIRFHFQHRRKHQNYRHKQPPYGDMLPPATTCLTLRMRNKSRQHQTSHTGV